MGKFIDLTGQRFNRLTVIKVAGKNKTGNYLWLCKCDCGHEKEIIVASKDLKTGNTKSCGCYNKERLSIIKRTHGLKGTPIYNSWQSMKDRCNNKNNKDYSLYGERGITYDFKWENFEGFYEDMGSTWFKKATLDRINCDGNYCKNNCRWITIQEQQNNKRNNVRTNLFGSNLNLSQIAKKYNINYHTVVERYNRGLRNEELISSFVNKAIKKSKVKGVTWDKGIEKWVSRIRINYKSVYLGCFTEERDAIISRLKAEKEYLSELAPQKYLFEQYGINAVRCAELD